MVSSSRLGPWAPVCYGAGPANSDHEGSVSQNLRCFLLEKGVAADSVDHRVQQGIQIFGVQSIEKALQSRNDPKCMAVLEGSREFKAEALSLAQLQRVARSDSSKGQIQMGCRS